jgi:hypothetical protein
MGVLGCHTTHYIMLVGKQVIKRSWRQGAGARRKKQQAQNFVSVRVVEHIPVAYVSQHGSPFIASHASRKIRGKRAIAAMGSAHVTLQIALATNPAKAIKAR